MKRSGLETLVLVIGVIVIGSAVFFIFIKQQTSNTIFITNLIISLGFLIYVIYSMMASNNLNREIRQLNNHVSSLKDEIAKLRDTVSEKESKISSLENDLSKSQEELKTANSSLATLKSKVAELESELNDKA